MLFSRIEKLIILLHSLLKDTDKNALVAVPIVIGMVGKASKCPGGGIGRRAGFKIQFFHESAGSIPARGTPKKRLQEIEAFFINVLSSIAIFHNTARSEGHQYKEDTFTGGKGNVEMAAMLYAIIFGLAGWNFLTKWRKPKFERDTLLMAFPFIYLVSFAYMYIAKFKTFFTVSAEGLNQEGLAVSNLLVVFIAIAIAATIVLLSHPVPKEK